MASTLKPSGGLILASMTGKIYETQQTQQAQPVIPQWTRPDDAERQARLDAMKRRATALLGVALLVFVVASIYEPLYPWLGFVRATAEASLVGGLADWFAVTALFRHPLGLPIPHTAIVATRKERIGQILGNFVQNHFLSREVIAANLRRVHPAERAPGSRESGRSEPRAHISRGARARQDAGVGARRQPAGRAAQRDGETRGGGGQEQPRPDPRARPRRDAVVGASRPR